jgi:hypothetical protein
LDIEAASLTRRQWSDWRCCLCRSSSTFSSRKPSRSDAFSPCRLSLRDGSLGARLSRRNEIVKTLPKSALPRNSSLRQRLHLAGLEGCLNSSSDVLSNLLARCGKSVRQFRVLTSKVSLQSGDSSALSQFSREGSGDYIWSAKTLNDLFWSLSSLLKKWSELTASRHASSLFCARQSCRNLARASTTASLRRCRACRSEKTATELTCHLG